MKGVDAVIILGGGVDGTSNPVLYTKERLEAFIRLDRRTTRKPIIVSGGHSVFIKKPRYAEAEVMKKYLISHGIPTSHIHLEKKSRDSITNAYYSKRIAKKHPRWANILIVTTDGHVARCRWIFNKVFGDKYKFRFMGVPSTIGGFSDNSSNRKRYEKYLIDIYRVGFSLVKKGDDKAILKIWKSLSPLYSQGRKAKEFAEAIRTAKQRFLGYISLPK